MKDSGASTLYPVKEEPYSHSCFQGATVGGKDCEVNRTTTPLQKVASGRDCGVGFRTADGGEEETNTKDQ